MTSTVNRDRSIAHGLIAFGSATVVIGVTARTPGLGPRLALRVERRT